MMWLVAIATAFGQSNREQPPVALQVGQVSTRTAQTCDDPKVATVDVTAGGKNNVRAVGIGETMCGSVDTYRKGSGAVAGDRTYFKVVVTAAPVRTYADGAVPAERLQPLQVHGIAAPKLWHDESARFDGSVACAVTDAEVVRVDGSAITRIPFDRIGSVDFQGTDVQGGWLTVAATDGAVVRCRFGANEGAAKFVEAIDYEAGVH
jgi:hypothetical protein